MYVYSYSASASASTTLLPSSLTDGNCFIARTNQTGADRLAGRVSSIKVYKDKGLTAAEVSRNYNALKHRYGL
jgi:hypothetical protein